MKPFLEEHKLNYPVVIGTHSSANRYGGLPSLPMTLLIDRDGKIAEWHPGMVEKDKFENELKVLLHKSPATQSRQIAMLGFGIGCGHELGRRD